MQIVSLNGTWELVRDATGEAVPAPVPGCVHTALIASGKIPDPFYRDNEKTLLWIGETDWTYRHSFDVSPEMLAHERVLLRCHGLDTIATLALNGQVIGTAENMYRTWEFDIRAHLHAGENTLAVSFAAPLTYAQRMDAEKGEMAGWVEPMRVNSAAWIRKEPCNFGWDWGPKLPTSGIWRDIELVAFNTARLQEVHVMQDHQDGKVRLDVRIAAEQVSTAALSADVRVERDGQLIAQAQQVQLAEGRGQVNLLIEQPELWFPNGMGAQPLYDVSVTLRAGAQSLDQVSKHIGLRVITLERHPDTWGESFYFTCNGVPFFAKGANWIPVSPYPGSVKRADYEVFVRAAAEANMNMLRVWGGGIYEDDAFYDLCDRYGITIWQDFMFACGTYPSFDADFMANVTVEAQQNVRRIRDHACIALWCGNNEIEQGLPSSPGWLQSMSWEDYSRLFDELLANIVHELDPQTAYWPGSPHTPCGERAYHMNPDCGDTHLWMVWHGKEPFEWYRTRPDRFCSEFGFQSFPEPQTIYDFSLPEDRNITSYVMEHHQRSGIGNSTIIHYLLDWFRLPGSFEATVWLSQILQGMAMKYAVEHWRRNMPRTMGTLYWQLNDMWPAPSWASVDWKGNWKALHYMAKRFHAPLLISGVEQAKNNTVDVHVTSDEGTARSAKVVWTVTSARGEVLERGENNIQTPVRANQHVMTLDLSRHVAERTVRDVVLWLELHSGGHVISSNTVLLARPKHFELANPRISTLIQAAPDGFDVIVRAERPAFYVWLELDGARFSDNFFDLAPGQTRIIRLTLPYEADIEDVRAALRVQSLIDTAR
jgi:beta-mannosidase